MITRVGKEDCERLANAALIAAVEYDRKALYISLSGQFRVIDQHIANAYRTEAQRARALARLVAQSREIVLT
jgi:hypothetical protein